MYAACRSVVFHINFATHTLWDPSDKCDRVARCRCWLRRWLRLVVAIVSFLKNKLLTFFGCGAVPCKKFSPFLWRLLLILNYGHVHSFYRHTNFTSVVHEHSCMRALTLCTLTIDMHCCTTLERITFLASTSMVYTASYVMCVFVATVSAQGGFMAHHSIWLDSIDNT